MSRRQRNNDQPRPWFGSTQDGGFYAVRGGYVRKHQKPLLTPPVDYWYPPQRVVAGLQEYGTPLNNPIPLLHHNQATRGTGRVYRVPMTPRYQVENYVPDGMQMFVTPDPTLTGYMAAAQGPEMYPYLWGYQPHVQFMGGDLW